MIPAGGTGTLTAKIKTTSTQNGPISKGIAVNTDARGAERLMLNVKFTAVSAVAVLPRAQINLRGIQGDSPVASVVLRRGDGKPLEVIKIVNTDERLVISVETVIVPRQVGRQNARIGDLVLNVTTKPGLGAVKENGRFKVRTNHPDAEPVDIVYSIRLLPIIEARPETVRLILQDGNSSARTALLKIQHNRRGKFKLTGATASNLDLFRANLINGDREQQIHNVAVMLLDEVKPGALQSRLFETLTLKIDDPDAPEITVSVHIEPRDLRRPGQPRPVQ